MLKVSSKWIVVQIGDVCECRWVDNACNIADAIFPTYCRIQKKERV